MCACKDQIVVPTVYSGFGDFIWLLIILGSFVIILALVFGLCEILSRFQKSRKLILKDGEVDDYSDLKPPIPTISKQVALEEQHQIPPMLPQVKRISVSSDLNALPPKPIPISKPPAYSSTPSAPPTIETETIHHVRSSNPSPPNPPAMVQVQTKRSAPDTLCSIPTLENSRSVPPIPKPPVEKDAEVIHKLVDSRHVLRKSKGGLPLANHKPDMKEIKLTIPIKNTQPMDLDFVDFDSRTPTPPKPSGGSFVSTSKSLYPLPESDGEEGRPKSPLQMARMKSADSFSTQMAMPPPRQSGSIHRDSCSVNMAPPLQPMSQMKVAGSSSMQMALPPPHPGNIERHFHTVNMAPRTQPMSQMKSVESYSTQMSMPPQHTENIERHFHTVNMVPPAQPMSQMNSVEYFSTQMAMPPPQSENIERHFHNVNMVAPAQPITQRNIYDFSSTQMADPPRAPNRLIENETTFNRYPSPDTRVVGTGQYPPTMTSYVDPMYSSVPQNYLGRIPSQLHYGARPLETQFSRVPDERAQSNYILASNQFSNNFNENTRVLNRNLVNGRSGMLNEAPNASKILASNIMMRLLRGRQESDLLFRQIQSLESKVALLTFELGKPKDVPGKVTKSVQTNGILLQNIPPQAMATANDFQLRNHQLEVYDQDQPEEGTNEIYPEQVKSPKPLATVTQLHHPPVESTTTTTTTFSFRTLQDPMPPLMSSTPVPPMESSSEITIIESPTFRDATEKYESLSSINASPTDAMDHHEAVQVQQTVTIDTMEAVPLKIVDDKQFTTDKQLATDMAQEIITDMAQKIITDMAQKITTDKAQKITTDMAQQITTDMAQQITTDMAQQITTDMAHQITTDSLTVDSDLGQDESLTENPLRIQYNKRISDKIAKLRADCQQRIQENHDEQQFFYSKRERGLQLEVGELNHAIENQGNALGGLQSKLTNLEKNITALSDEKAILEDCARDIKHGWESDKLSFTNETRRLEEILLTMKSERQDLVKSYDNLKKANAALDQELVNFRILMESEDNQKNQENH